MYRQCVVGLSCSHSARNNEGTKTMPDQPTTPRATENLRELQTAFAGYAQESMSADDMSQRAAMELSVKLMQNAIEFVDECDRLDDELAAKDAEIERLRDGLIEAAATITMMQTDETVLADAKRRGVDVELLGREFRENVKLLIADARERRAQIGGGDGA